MGLHPDMSVAVYFLCGLDGFGWMRWAVCRNGGLLCAGWFAMRERDSIRVLQLLQSIGGLLDVRNAAAFSFDTTATPAADNTASAAAGTATATPTAFATRAAGARSWPG